MKKNYVASIRALIEHPCDAPLKDNNSIEQKMKQVMIKVNLPITNYEGSQWFFATVTETRFGKLYNTIDNGLNRHVCHFTEREVVEVIDVTIGNK